MRALDALKGCIKDPKKSLDQWAVWNDRLVLAEQKVQQRRARAPEIRYPEDLPVSQRSDEICHLIRTHAVVIIAGETGSGKTTQIPKMCLQAGQGVLGQIGHTQPRRVAARSVAERLSEELGTTLGQTVGYQVRFSDTTSGHGYIKVMTDGILLAEIQRDPSLSLYDTLIIDEAHERSLNIDFLLGYLKSLLKKRRDLKVIITSATIDVDKFSAHFDHAPVVQVSGRSYPVEIVYRPYETALMSRPQAVLECVNDILSQHSAGDILVFLSGEREIRETSIALRRANLSAIEVVPLYARLSLNEQSRVFSPSKARRVVLATNVAETSLTVPRIGFVVDVGHARVSRYSYRTKVQRLQIEAISQASANQRAGRCGRVRAGVCFRLYSEDDYSRRPEFTDPELLRTSLAAVILRMLHLRMGDIYQFPFIDKPDRRMINDGYKLLEELQAVSRNGELTALGKKMVAIPVDPRFSRMLIEASRMSALSEILVIASVLSVQDPRERPAEGQQKANQLHAQWEHKDSDFMTFLNLWRGLDEHRQSLSKNQFAKYCRRQCLSFLRVQEWRDLHRQLSLACRKLGLRETSSPASYSAVHRAILCGLLSHVAVNDRGREFMSTRNRRVFIFPTSGQVKKPPKWMVAASLMETTKQYALNVAKIDPTWIAPLAQHLVNSSYSEPFYHLRSGQVMAKRRQTLFGLTIADNEKVQYGKVNPDEAYTVFLQQALVEEGYRGTGTFHAANRRLLDELQALEDRIRRRDLVADELTVQRFYHDRVPNTLCNLADFEKWRSVAEDKNPELLQMTQEDLLSRAIDGQELAQFPSSLDYQENCYVLRYRFEPEHSEDGVSAIIPLALLHELPRHLFEWLVPGMLRDKCITLLKSLPKHLRRQLVPVPATVDLILRGLNAQNRPLIDVLGEQIQRHFGLIVAVTDWNVQRLDPWYLMNFILLDEQGQIVASSRNAVQLQNDYKVQISASIQQAGEGSYTRSGLKKWDFDELPKEVTLQNGPLSITAWPALRDCGDSVALELMDDPHIALATSRDGQLRLALLKSRDTVRYLAKNLLRGHDLALAAAGLAKRERIVDALISAAVNEALFSAGTVVRHRDEFEACHVAGAGRIVDIAQLQAGLLADLLSDLNRIRRTMGDLKGDAAYIKEDVNRQLKGLLSPESLAISQSPALRNYARYVRALTIRLDKWPLQMSRDRDYTNQLALFLDPYYAALQQQQCLPELVRDAVDAFGWQIEELRVSLFAQQLKTPRPVSSKRLATAWSRIASELPRPG